ncbi:hypothetical protein DRO24_05365 [Candidatus Bathyarchaeota archaeon]|nr:MAG: hypothetical protein DRO24_05365 [Candidatus Bathyarchaeota archaeon]
MIKGVKDTKLLVVPAELADRLKEVAVKHRVSLSAYVASILREALRAEEMGVTLGEALSLYRMMEIQRGAGVLQAPRTALQPLLSKAYREVGEELRNLWFEAGRWYGQYLKTRLGDENPIGFLEEVLRYHWNLDEVSFRGDDLELLVSLVSFTLSREGTELLSCYISGILHSLGFREEDRLILEGLAKIRFRRMPGWSLKTQ